ncbi:FAD binding domain-containing protein [Sedimentitalea arenosa]|uniref:FAD binding domain-containing protein n=1 Tax=Sedimentitalea arenosa TaxID=2798803 RepID=A0A8J7LZT4_9RHOB|nr:FAD binding domain-containing protein [Arenibacterium arenosum]MBJ6372206.1 FAD binding domain-containing protein [Arenibacterium arenosum]
MDAYFRPDTVDDALAVLARAGVTVAAGCTDLFPATERQTLSGPVLDLTAIPSLRGISETEAGWRIGATTTWTDVLGADLPPAFDMLKQAAREVGSVQIQNAGTVAGNLCNASPAADGVPPLLALDACVELAGPTGRREMPLSAFLTGARQIARAPDELVIAIRVPRAAGAGRSRFLKLGARRYLVISIVMVAVRLEHSGGRVDALALSVGACSAVATRLNELEAALRGAPIAELSERIAEPEVARALSPIDDMRADASYRVVAATRLLRRAVAELSAAASS